MDRSGAYICRQAAKSVVAGGLARRCLVQVSYSIGVPEPLSVFVDTYGTGKRDDGETLSFDSNRALFDGCSVFLASWARLLEGRRPRCVMLALW